MYGANETTNTVQVIIDFRNDRSINVLNVDVYLEFVLIMRTRALVFNYML